MTWLGGDTARSATGTLMTFGSTRSVVCRRRWKQKDLRFDPSKEVGPMNEVTDIERTGDVSNEYETARKRVQRKRKFRTDVVAYVVINACLIAVWAVNGFGYFWPGWVLAGWGVALVLDAWNVFFQRPITQDDINREIRNSR
jgi:2TM domain